MGASDKKYNLEIELCATFPIGYDYSPQELTEHIKDVDTINPWVTYYHSGEQAASINWMSTPVIIEGGGVDRLYLVRIRPPMLGSFTQAVAYERYGENLAHNLAHILPTDVLCVQSRLNVHGTFDTRHQNPQCQHDL